MAYASFSAVHSIAQRAMQAISQSLSTLFVTRRSRPDRSRNARKEFSSRKGAEAQGALICRVSRVCQMTSMVVEVTSKCRLQAGDGQFQISLFQVTNECLVIRFAYHCDNGHILCLQSNANCMELWRRFSFASPQALALPPGTQTATTAPLCRLRIAFELTNPIQEEQQITANSKR